MRRVKARNIMCPRNNSENRNAKVYGYTLTLTVKEIKGKCDVGHKIGDKIIFDGLNVKGKICLSALATLMPTIYAFAWGAEFPWTENRDITTIPCPDEVNQVVFELKRDRRNPWYSGKQI